MERKCCTSWRGRPFGNQVTMSRTRDHCHSIEHDRHGTISSMTEIGTNHGFPSKPRIDHMDVARRIRMNRLGECKLHWTLTRSPYTAKVSAIRRKDLDRCALARPIASFSIPHDVLDGAPVVQGPLQRVCTKDGDFSE